MDSEADFNFLLMSSTPKSCDLNRNPPKRRAMESPASRYTKPVPITPMPNFNDMDTPEIQRRAQRYGLKKKMAKSKLRTKLQEVYMYSHQIYCSPQHSAIANDFGDEISHRNRQNLSKNNEASTEIISSVNKSTFTSRLGATQKDISKQRKLPIELKENCSSLTLGNIIHTAETQASNNIAISGDDNSINGKTFCSGVTESHQNQVVNLCDESLPEVCGFDDFDLSGVVRMHNNSNTDIDQSVKNLTSSSKKEKINFEISDENSSQKSADNDIIKEPCAVISLLDSSGESEYLQKCFTSRNSIVTDHDVLQERKSFPFSLRTSEQKSEFVLADDSNVIPLIEDNGNCKNGNKIDTDSRVGNGDGSDYSTTTPQGCNSSDYLVTQNGDSDEMCSALPAGNAEYSKKTVMFDAEIDSNSSSVSNQCKPGRETPTLCQNQDLPQDAKSENSVILDLNDQNEDFYINDDLPQSPYMNSWSPFATEGVISTSGDANDQLAPSVGFGLSKSETSCNNEVISLLDESHDNIEPETYESSQCSQQNDSDSQELAGSDHEELHRSLFVSVHQGESSGSESSSSDEEEECKSLMQRLMDKNKKTGNFCEKIFSPEKVKNGNFESESCSESILKHESVESFRNLRKDDGDKALKKVNYFKTDAGENTNNKELTINSDGKSKKKMKKVKLEGVELTKAIYNAIRLNDDIYSSILQYKPVYLSQFKQLMVENNVRVKASDLLDFLDSRGITFSTADENKNKGSRTAKRRVKKSAKS